MKLILTGVAITAVLLFAAWSLFRPLEEYREESGHTVYRVPGGIATELPSPTPTPQIISGESRRARSGEN